MKIYNWIKVGQIIVPADGSNYTGIIISVSKDDDTVKHKCLKTGQVYEKSYLGFRCRYIPKENQIFVE